MVLRTILLLLFIALASLSANKHARKREEKLARARRLIEKQNAVDPNTRKIQGRVALDGSTPMQGDLRLVDATKPVTNDAAAPTGWVQGGLDSKANQNHSHSMGDLPSNVATKSDIPNVPNSTSSALNGSYRHNHSISSTPFIKRTREERLAMLADRRNLRALLDHGALTWHEEVLARNTLNTLSLLMDYREFDAYERERRLEDPEWAGWAEEYKRVYGVDEYGEADRERFIECEPGVRMDPYEGIASVAEWSPGA